MDSEGKAGAEIDKRSLVDQVYEYLLNKITEGEIKYGTTISIKEIAQVLGVSTMPVREAIKRLEFEQIVDIKPRSNCQVKIPTPKTIMEIYEIREVLELYAIRRSISQPDEKVLSRLRSITEDMQELEKVEDIRAKEKRAIELDRRFHTVLCSMAGNLHLNMSFIHEQTYHSLEDQYYESHLEIVESLTNHPNDAAMLLKRHFNEVKKILFTEKQLLLQP